VNTPLTKMPFADKLLLLTGGLILLSTVAFRIRFLNLPIDRDEGEFAYAGWQMLHGDIPYRDFYNMKMPGIYLFYALLFSVLGTTIQAIRTGLIIVNLLNTFLVYRLTVKWSDMRTGIYASVCYLLFSMQVELQGTSTHAEFIAMLFVLSGFLIFPSANSSRRQLRLFWSGVSLGTAFIVKQPSASFIVLGLVFLLINKFKNRSPQNNFVKSIVTFLAGALIPILTTAFLLVAAGAGNSFYLFAFQYAKEYVSYLTIYDGVNNFKIILSKAIAPNIFLWLLVPVGFVILFFRVKKSASEKLLFFLFSFIAVSAGYYYRPHYFQFLIPAASMLSAVALVETENHFKRKNFNPRPKYFLSYCYMLLALTFYSFNERSLFSVRSEEQAIREIYGQDFFNATKKAGDFIAANSSEDATVAIFGSEPEIWFYSKRKSASGYLYVYPLLEHQRFAPSMRQQFYDEIRKSKPGILVYTSNTGTWYAGEDVHSEMYNWYRQYRDSSFNRIGLINIPYDSLTTYDWSGDMTATLVHDNYIEICKRR
jgi:hypothetical protein